MNCIKDNEQRKTTAAEKYVIRRLSEKIFKQAFFGEVEIIKVLTF